MTKHTKEPWCAKEYRSPYNGRLCAEFKSLAQASRARLCVNACAGIGNEALESGVVGEMRDALVEAAAAISNSTPRLEHEAGSDEVMRLIVKLNHEAENAARAVLAKLEVE